MSLSEKTLTTYSACFAALIAGLVHLSFVAYSHWAPLPLEGVFFISIGILQIVWGYLFLQSPKRSHFYAGFVLHGGVLMMWFLTRFITAPFHGGPESIGVIDTFVMLLQVLAIGASIVWIHRHRVNTFKVVTYALLGALLVGFVMFQASIAMEGIFPDRAGPEHHDAVPHGHDEEEQHVESPPSTSEEGSKEHLDDGHGH